MAIIVVTDDPYMRDFYHWVLQGHWEGGFNPVDEGFEWNVAGGGINNISIGFPKQTFWFELGNNPDYLSSRKLYYYRAWHTYYDGEDLIKIYGEMKQFTAINPNCTGFTNFQAKKFINKYFSYHGGRMVCKIQPQPGTFVCEPTDLPWGPEQQMLFRDCLGHGWHKYGWNYPVVHDAPEGAAQMYHVGQYYQVSKNRHYIKRYGLIWNTEDLPVGCLVTRAVITMVGAGDLSTTDFSIVIMNGYPEWPHDPWDLEGYYYGNYNGNGGSINTSGGNYTVFELSEEGLLMVRPGAKTKLCLRSQNDIDSIQPTGEEFVKYNPVPADTTLEVWYKLPI